MFESRIVFVAGMALHGVKLSVGRPYLKINHHF